MDRITINLKYINILLYRKKAICNDFGNQKIQIKANFDNHFHCNFGPVNIKYNNNYRFGFFLTEVFTIIFFV